MTININKKKKESFWYMLSRITAILVLKQAVMAGVSASSAPMTRPLTARKFLVVKLRSEHHWPRVSPWRQSRSLSRSRSLGIQSSLASFHDSDPKSSGGRWPPGSGLDAVSHRVSDSSSPLDSKWEIDNKSSLETKRH